MAELAGEDPELEAELRDAFARSMTLRDELLALG